MSEAKTWKVEFDTGFHRQLERIRHSDQLRILNFLQGRLVAQPDPLALAKRLQGTTRPLWRFRVGDYRIIAEIREKELVIVAVSVANRREVYR
jgi:mRNA interferase RelE/StbE